MCCSFVSFESVHLKNASDYRHNHNTVQAQLNIHLGDIENRDRFSKSEAQHDPKEDVDPRKPVDFPCFKAASISYCGKFLHCVKMHWCNKI